MNKESLELKNLLMTHKDHTAILDYLSKFHENDIADILVELDTEDRKQIYHLLGSTKTAEVFSYFDDPSKYIQELSSEYAVHLLSHMDSDDAADVLETLDPETKETLVQKLDKETAQDITRLLSYEEDEIGSYMTTNYVSIKEGLSIRQAMSELVRQAGIHDNIMTLYVVDQERKLVGAIDLKDLITAREHDPLEDIMVTSYPFVTEHEKVDHCMERILDYAEDSIPVLNQEKVLLGVITSEDMVEMVDNEMGEDYAKLAGLTSEEDLTETTLQSIQKRIPWLIALLFLGMLVSSVVGIFEGVVAAVPLVICFQSMVLDMAGNVGTQSLAVTIRVLMDEQITSRKKLRLLFKEGKIGLLNGSFLGILSFLLLGIYIHISKDYGFTNAFLVSGCVGISLMVAMVVSSLIGTLIPMFFHKIKIDPAVASGPLITTINDLVAVITYYGLAYLLLVRG